MLKSLFPWKHNKTKQVMAAQPPMDEELIIQEQNLVPCHVCGRTFLPNPLKRHEKVCEKNATKKRKPFDSLKQRVSGTDLADFHQKSYLKKKEDPIVEKKPRQSKWKEKHLELVTAIRAAKGVPSSTMPSSPPPKPRSTTSLITSTSQNERCPSCERHFGPKAFDRHVEWCKERKARIQQSPASVLQAKERLEARTKYRVPPLIKSKRTLVKEKYSPHSPEPASTRGTQSSNNLSSSLSRGPSIRKPKSLVDVEKCPTEVKERLSRSDVDKCNGDRNRSSIENDRNMSLSFGTPVIGSPSPKAESVKSLQNKRPQAVSKKLNSINVNGQIEGLTVSSISSSEVNKRMVTWKDTVKKINIADKSIRSDSKLISKGQSDSKLKEFSNLSSKLENVHLEERRKNIEDVLHSSSVTSLVKSSKILKTGEPLKHYLKIPKLIEKHSDIFLEEGLNTPNSSSETQVEANTIKERPKAELEKIISYSDIFNRKKVTKIPTVIGFKNVSNVLKRHKKAPDKCSNKNTASKDVEPVINKHVDEECLHKENCSQKCETNSEEITGLNESSNDFKKGLSSFLQNNTGDTTYLNTHLKSVYELDYSLHNAKTSGQNIDHNFEEADAVNPDAGPTDMNVWFETHFRDDDENEKDITGNDEESHSECFPFMTTENTSLVECEGMGERDSLEDSGENNNSNNIDSDFNEILSRESDFICSHSKNIETKLNEVDSYQSVEDSSNILSTLNSNTDTSTNVVCLFQSGTDIDLTRDNSLNAITDQSSWTSIGTRSIQKNSNQISNETVLVKTEESEFSLKKSFSDINIRTNSLMSIVQKQFSQEIIPLFVKNKFVSESESRDFRKTCQDIRSICSTPAMHLARFSFKKSSGSVESVNGSLKLEKLERESTEPDISSTQPPVYEKRDFSKTIVDWTHVKNKERLEILRIAAEKFIEETKRENIPDNFTSILDEDYSVPKKKRRICVSDSEDSLKSIEHIDNPSEYFSVVDHSISSLGKGDLNVEPSDKKVSATRSLKEKLIAPDSAASSVISDVTPRTTNLIEKIIQAKKLKENNSNVLLAISISECERLLVIDKKYVDKVEKRLDKDREIKLPLIVGNKISPSRKSGALQVGAEELPKISVTLPRIVTKKSCGPLCHEEAIVSQSNSSNYDPFEIAQRQFMELLDCEDFKPFTPSDPMNCTPGSHTTVNTPLKTPTSPICTKKTTKSADAVKKSNRQSVIEPPLNFKDSLDSVNGSDEFELIENIINEHFGGNDIGKENNSDSSGFYLHNLKNNKDSLTLDDILDNRKYSDDLTSSIDPSLINENDNLSIPENFKIDDYSPTSTADTETTLQNDIDHYSAQYDSKIEAIEPKATKKPLVKRSLSLVSRSKRDNSVSSTKNAKSVHNSNNNNNNKKGVTSSNKTTTSKYSKYNVSSEKSFSHENKSQKQEKKKGLPLLKRSMTLFDPSPKPSFKNKQEVNAFFKGEDRKNMSSSLTASMTTSLTSNVERSVMKTSAKPVSTEDPTLKAEDLFSVDDEMYEEYKKYEEMYLKEKEQSANTNKKHKNKNIDMNFGLLTNSEEEDHSNNSNNKLSNDSAYGSLRKTSKHRSRAPKLAPLEPQNIESTSSSGSENGLNSPAPLEGSAKVSKFCHECGTKFPVPTAKFCIECGVKRLVL